MGYRHYLYAIPKKQITEIQACKTNEDWLAFTEKYGYRPDYGVTDDGSGYFSPHELHGEIYELGKYSEIGFELEGDRQKVFASKELQERYRDYGFVLLLKEDFLKIIEWYKKKIINYYECLLHPEKDEMYNIIPQKCTKEQR